MKTKKRPAPTSATISGELRAIIAERSLSAFAVAQMAGVNPSSVSRFLSRERGLTSESLDAIASAMGLRLAKGRGGKSQRTGA